MNPAVLHAQVERGEVRAGARNGVGQKYHILRAACGASSMLGRQSPGCILPRRIDRPCGQSSGPRKHGDFAMFNVEFNSSLAFHAPSAFEFTPSEKQPFSHRSQSESS
jgi:hypothetical protein